MTCLHYQTLKLQLKAKFVVNLTDSFKFSKKTASPLLSCGAMPRVNGIRLVKSKTQVKLLRRPAKEALRQLSIMLEMLFLLLESTTRSLMLTLAMEFSESYLATTEPTIPMCQINSALEKDSVVRTPSKLLLS